MRRSRLIRHERVLPLTAAIAVAILIVALPRPGATTVAEPPEVDLGRMRTVENEITAPVRGGGTATLTLHPELQAAAQRLLEQARPSEGALVLLDARRGRLLAAATFSTENATGESILTRHVPAASVFKLVTTAALLEKYVDPSKMVCFRGGERSIDESHLAAARGPEARCSPFRNALGYSRNAVFAQLATGILRPNDLLATAKRLGFNGAAPSDLPASVGTLKLPEEKLAFARAAAGFRGSTLSPVGAAHLAYVVAHRGRAARMRIVERAEGFEAPKKRKNLGQVLNESVAVELRRMMEITVHAGTSLEAFTNSQGTSYLGDVRIAGKTGTLQGAGAALTTMWFTGFAPSRRPEVVVTVMLNNGRVWRRKANEVARDMLRVFFARKRQRGVTDPFEDVVPTVTASHVTDGE
jgi:peptidoglycan glycosyltransferase